jgi:hypothetical protein
MAKQNKRADKIGSQRGVHLSQYNFKKNNEVSLFHRYYNVNGKSFGSPGACARIE